MHRISLMVSIGILLLIVVLVSYSRPAPSVSGPVPGTTTTLSGWRWGSGRIAFWHIVEIPSGRTDYEDVRWDFRVATIDSQVYHWNGARFGSECFCVSMWFAAVCILPSAFVGLSVASTIQSARRERRGACRNCGYDLRGASSDRCSECGSQLADDQADSAR